MKNYLLAKIIGVFWAIFFSGITFSQPELPELVFQGSHSAQINTVIFTPDGKYLVSSGQGGDVKIWEVNSGLLCRTISAHNGWLTPVALTPDGTFAAVGCEDGAIRIWNLLNGKLDRILSTKSESIYSVAISPDGKILASGSADKKLRIWDIAARRLLATQKAHSSFVSSIAFSADGKYLASSSFNEGKVKIWQIPSGRLQNVFEPFKFEHFKGDDIQWVDQVLFCPVSGYLITSGHSINFDPKPGEHSDDGVKIWDIANGTVLKSSLNEIISMNAAAISPDGKILAVNSANAILLYDLGIGECLGNLKGHTNGIETLAFSPDGTMLASGSKDETIRLWDVKKRQISRVFGAKVLNTDAIVVSPNGDFLAFSRGLRTQAGAEGDPYNVVELWNLKTGQPVQHLQGDRYGGNAIKFSPDGSCLGFECYDEGIVLWDLILNKKSGTLKAMKQGFIDDFAFNEEELLVARDGGWSNILFSRWNGWRFGSFVPVYPEEERNVKKKSEFLPRIKFSQNGKIFASCGYDTKKIRIWNSQDGRLLKTLDAIKQSPMVFSPNGSLLAYIGRYENLQLHNLDETRNSKKFTGSYNVLEFSPDSRTLAAVKTSIDLWDVNRGQIRLRLSGHPGAINAVAFHSDGRLLYTAGEEGSIMVWELNRGRHLATILSFNENDWIVFSPEGFFDGTQQAWRLVNFRFPSEPMRLYAPEQFFNQFYQPDLLADVIREGKSIREILKDREDPRANLDISAYRNSTLPEIRIVSPKMQSQPFTTKTITVKVQAKDTGSGLRDLRIFRNGTLAHIKRGILSADPQSGFYYISVPIQLVAGENKISAYVFNHDNLKSKEDAITITVEKYLKRKGNVYIIATGIDTYADPDYNLNYAVADAVAFTDSLARNLANLDDYKSAIPITLINGEATKKNILASLSFLAGETRGVPASIARKLKKAKPVAPEDVVVFYFSGHGSAWKNGYYLIPHEFGSSGTTSLTVEKDYPQQLAQAISDQELQNKFEKIDVGTVMLIIDACQSGQALESEEKRLGPMNSRGLAQVAFEKGMYVLTAAQSYETARELEKFGHGIFTYLFLKGLSDFWNADIDPKDKKITIYELFNYVSGRVPGESKQALMNYANKTGKEIDFGFETVKGQSPRAYYRSLEDAKSFILNLTKINAIFPMSIEVK